MPKLSIVTTAHNSENFLDDCLKSVAFADEIIVVDNESTDKTVEIAKKHQAKVFKHHNNPKQLNESKNFGFTKASHEWILSLDPDERVENDLKKEIEYILSKEDIPLNGYKIPRHNVIFGKVIEHGLWYPDYQLRLFRKGRGKFPDIHNHEALEITGDPGVLKGHIQHHNYQTITQYVQKIDKQYSDNEVDTYLDRQGKIYWYDAIRFPMQDFLSNYFARQAYKDGLHGLVLSILQAFYMFIVFAKIWERQGFKQEKIELDEANQEFKNINKQIKYWYLHEQIKDSNLLKRLQLKLKSRI